MRPRTSSVSTPSGASKSVSCATFQCRTGRQQSRITNPKSELSRSATHRLNQQHRSDQQESAIHQPEESITTQHAVDDPAKQNRQGDSWKRQEKVARHRNREESD